MDSIREKIYLSALIHDIGKFYQRTTGGNAERNSVFKTLFGSDSSNLFDNTHPIIKEAHCLSLGVDREELETEKEGDKRERMISILQTIASKESSANMWYWPVEELNLDSDFFPKESFNEDPDYTTLWNKFAGEFKQIQPNSDRAFSETLLSLLYKYTSTVPASTVHCPDVSLYDHLRTTAALSVCLYDYKESKEQNKESKEQNNAPFLLIGADFSGIQNYIYQIVSKYAGKNLKGRSFYLRILSDAVARYILKELDLFQANIIYNSGGCFYILAPNTAKVKDKLVHTINTIEEHFYKAHGTSLYVAIDSVELSKDALMRKNGNNLRKVWGELFVKRDRKKNAKFDTLIKHNYTQFFTPSQQGGGAKRDSITGEEFNKEEKIKEVEESGLLLSELSYAQIEIGQKLREATYMVIKQGDELPYWSDKAHIAPASLGLTYYLVNQEELKDARVLLNDSADSLTIIALNGDFPWDQRGHNNIYGIDFYGGNEVIGRDIPTFEKMCDDNDNFKRLGVLRMDVDNLGFIFQQGIAENRATLSRYAALSRTMDYFFSGYINTIWNKWNKIAPDQSFIIYSGGDDLFIVASWDISIKIAEQIHTDFREFTCKNKAFSVSGGVAILPPKYPIMKGAEESAGQESLAKNHTCHKHDKNAISFFSMPLNWELEYPVVKELKDVMVGLLLNKKMPKSFLSKVMTHCEIAKIKNHKITEIKTYWMLTYDLSRFKSRNDNDEISKLVQNCINEVCGNSKSKLNGKAITTDYHPLELWSMAARWAELEYRKTNN